MRADNPVSRRAFGLGGVALALLAAPALALPAPSRQLDPALLPGLRFHAIMVDTGPMAAKGVRVFAELMHRSLVPALAKTFADRLAPGDPHAPVLRVVIDGAEFASEVGADSDPAAANDYMEGAGLVLGRRNEALGSYPVLSALGATRPDRTDSEESHVLRAQLLAESFSYWLRRGIGI